METEADKARNDLLDLVESLKTKRILTGTIQGIERPADHPSRSLAVIYAALSVMSSAVSAFALDSAQPLSSASEAARSAKSNI